MTPAEHCTDLGILDGWADAVAEAITTNPTNTTINPSAQTVPQPKNRRDDDEREAGDACAPAREAGARR